MSAWDWLFDRMDSKFDLRKGDLMGLGLESDEAQAKFQKFLRDRKYYPDGTGVLRYSGADVQK